MKKMREVKTAGCVNKRKGRLSLSKIAGVSHRLETCDLDIRNKSP